MPKEIKEMEIKTIKSIREKAIKVEKVRDYYQVFVDLLKVEDEYLHYKEHLALRPL